MDEHETVAAYNALAKKWHDQHKDLGFLRSEMDLFQTLLPAGKIIEIGAGGGRDANDLIARGYEYYGTEPAEKLIEIAREYNPGATFEQKSIYELEPADYDGFWASAVLLHIPRARIAEALGKLRRAVRDGAIGYITIKEGDGERIETDDENAAAKRLFVLWHDEAFREELARAGFEVVKYERAEITARTIWLMYFVRAI